MLDVADFGRNPQGAEFGEFGVCYVRYGKAKKGSPPKRRSVLTVLAWVADVLEEWFTEVRPLFGAGGNPAALAVRARPAGSGASRIEHPVRRLPAGPRPRRRAWTSTPSAAPTSPT